MRYAMPRLSPDAQGGAMSDGDGAIWQPDVLGPEFEQLMLPLGVDDEGDVVATLVRHRPEGGPRFRWPWHRDEGGAASGADVLYVHGWSDYFFNPEIARFWSGTGA